MELRVQVVAERIIKLAQIFNLGKEMCRTAWHFEISRCARVNSDVVKRL